MKPGGTWEDTWYNSASHALHDDAEVSERTTIVVVCRLPAASLLLLCKWARCGKYVGLPSMG